MSGTLMASAIIDFSGSAAVNFIGNGVPEIGDAMLAQIRQLEFVHQPVHDANRGRSSLRSCSISRANTFHGGRVFHLRRFRIY